MESNILTLVGSIVIGIGIGFGLIALIVYRTVRKFEIQIRELAQDTLQEVEAHMVGVVVEEHEGQLYFYRDTDRQFLCQGSGLLEIRKRFNELYPDKIAFLSGGDPALVERLKNELTNLKNQKPNENSVSV